MGQRYRAADFRRTTKPIRSIRCGSRCGKTRFPSADKATYPGFLEEFQGAAPGAKIYFTPQPLFFNVTTDWAVALQKMYAGQVSVDDGLDQLAANITQQLSDAGITN